MEPPFSTLQMKWLLSSSWKWVPVQGLAIFSLKYRALCSSFMELLNSLQVFLTLSLRFSSRSLWLMLRVFSVAWFRYSCNWEWSCKYKKMKLIITKSRSWLVPSDLLTVFTAATWQIFSMVTGWQVNTERTSNISQVRLQRGQVVNRIYRLGLTYLLANSTSGKSHNSSVSKSVTNFDIIW